MLSLRPAPQWSPLATPFAHSSTSPKGEEEYTTNLRRSQRLAIINPEGIYRALPRYSLLVKIRTKWEWRESHHDNDYHSPWTATEYEEANNHQIISSPSTNFYIHSATTATITAKHLVSHWVGADKRWRASNYIRMQIFTLTTALIVALSTIICTEFTHLTVTRWHSTICGPKDGRTETGSANETDHRAIIFRIWLIFWAAEQRAISVVGGRIVKLIRRLNFVTHHFINYCDSLAAQTMRKETPRGHAALDGNTA